MACLSELFGAEEENEARELRRVVGASLVADAFEDLRILRKALTKKS